MNTSMWNHKITREHLERLVSFGFHITQPIDKRLMCGDVGMGAMASIQEIMQDMELILNNRKK